MHKNISTEKQSIHSLFNRDVQFVSDGGVSKIQLSLASTDNDHARDVVSGAVRAEGVSLVPMVLPIEEIFYRFIYHREWDISEMSMGKFISMVASGDQGIVGIPVFPSRVFRHSAMYVRAHSDIRHPQDLVGKTVGIPEWAQTAGIYVRGCLQENYGVDLRTIKWVQAGVNQPGRREKVLLNLPQGIHYENHETDTLNQLLLSGAVDAVISARPPADFSPAPGSPIVRLFKNPRGEEERFYEETRIFPIMHVIAMRQSVFERHPWVAMSLYKCFDQAKQRSVQRMRDIAGSAIPLAWASETAEDVIARFDGNPWPYGIDANLTTLSAFCRYVHDQGITASLIDPYDLFPREVRSQVRV